MNLTSMNLTSMNLATLITTTATTTITVATTTTTTGSPIDGRFSGSWVITLIVVGGALLGALLGLVGIWLHGYMQHHWPKVLPVPVEPIPAPQQPTPQQWIETMATRGQCPPVVAAVTATTTTAATPTTYFPEEHWASEDQKAQGKQQTDGDRQGPEENNEPGNWGDKRLKVTKKAKFWSKKTKKKPV